jgi:hypothetical protein
MNDINKHRQVVYYDYAKTKHWTKSVAKYQIQGQYGISTPLYYPYKFNIKRNRNSYTSLQYKACSSNCKLGYFYNIGQLANAIRTSTPKEGKEIVNELFSFGLRQTIFATCHLNDLNTIKKYFDLAYVIKVPTGYGKDIRNDNYYIYHILILNPYNNSHVKDGGKSIKVRTSSKKKEWPIDRPSVEIIQVKKNEGITKK